ncbi:MAG: hypothetical protein EP343_23045 [Deltaproteobacteria bacterium]|nr:MAG: hypothetical protein EP343_23045 [Deltaproteobacteria bacterium]
MLQNRGNYRQQGFLWLVATMVMLALGGGASASKKPMTYKGKTHPKKQVSLMKRFQRADTVLIGGVAKITGYSVLESMPPIHVLRFKLGECQSIKGRFDCNQEIHYSTRNPKALPKKGQRWLLALKMRQQTLPKSRVRYSLLYKAPVTKKSLRIARIAAKTPLVWKSWNRKPLGQYIRLDVAQVQPFWQHKWVNPYGDGVFRITITNTDYQTHNVPALKVLGRGPGRRIFWERALLVTKEGQLHEVPGASKVSIPKEARTLVLRGGESVSVNVNVLRLGCKICPGGGGADYTFHLGAKSISSFFYYSHKYHSGLANSSRLKRNK